MDYKKLKAFLKSEQKEVDAGKGAASTPRTAPHPNGYEHPIGTGSAFYVASTGEIEEGTGWPRVIEDTRMADFYTRKEAIEPIACLRPTMHHYSVFDHKSKEQQYRKLSYEIEGDEPGSVLRKCVWVDRRFLDILDSADTLQSFTNVGQPDYHGSYKIELVEPTLVRVKKSNSYFEAGKGKVVYWTTVAYLCTLNMRYSRLEGIGEDEVPEGVEA